MDKIIDIVLQTLISFFAILFITRLLGRQQLAQLTIYEYINGITFGSIAATVATDLDQSSTGHLVGLFLFGFLTLFMAYLSKKNRTVSKVIQGEPVLVIQDGHIFEEVLSRFHYTADDLTHMLRTKDIFHISDVKYGILETNGELSIVKIAGKENVKMEDLNKKAMQEELETEIIVTGNIIYENLQKRNLRVKWLMDQLKSKGVHDIRDIYFATVDKNNKVYMDFYKDNLKKPVDIQDNVSKKK